LIANRSKLKYGGKTLAQLVKTPAKESSSTKKKKKKNASKQPTEPTDEEQLQ
jgi:hypothetical protein